MPNKDRNIPKRRFKEFENADAWELRKLGELGTLKNGMNFSKDAMGIGFPFINLQNIFGKNIVDVSQLGLAKASSIQLKNYNLQKGDVLFVRSSVKLEGVGEAAIVPKNLENTTYSGFIIRYRDSFGLDYNFKRFTFGTSNIRNQIMSQATDSANKNISQQVLAELDILVPSLPEQSAIGTFFSTLDRHITLHQRKLDKLKCVKQAYLSEMFPAEGERVPKRRFPGFTDAWELRKLGEVVYRSNLTSSSKDLPRLEFEDINSGLGTLNKDISQKVDDRKGLEFNEGDVLFGKLRPYLKNWWYAEFKGIALGDFWNLKSDLWHSCFLYTYIQSNSFQLVANDTSGTKMPRSDWNLVAESIAKFPSLPEQEAIGTFFSTLDQQITLHQRKLEKLKNLKKALLNELFV
ncbi:restriction endonuclease subunit S [Streptococcus suis]|uniref:restriction endonuclease subunit S n=1 Tax=Streptococcus suis TaxID=1307 RepID=UPI00201B071A|nr:restriction endonuclease subunit S [Streptococcus suis]MCL4934010.1 restriction endonuclease subunit S [Streptococcus suis]